ncbi:hypothetical protein KQ304_06970 [Synechococcus sp. CS-1329]|uniref:hypothetical protein n=1 Tax=Synechococcus sp. CS-1329 TaxID=2847975 RepID=UPI00223BA1AC|nr:hypothetical protein [Synechococcus sp. CS-1329]MCT0218739.1 hypothetical protein [Synechococcus sp. CS-1329]
MKDPKIHSDHSKNYLMLALVAAIAIALPAAVQQAAFGLPWLGAAQEGASQLEAGSPSLSTPSEESEQKGPTWWDNIILWRILTAIGLVSSGTSLILWAIYFWRYDISVIERGSARKIRHAMRSRQGKSSRFDDVEDHAQALYEKLSKASTATELHKEREERTLQDRAIQSMIQIFQNETASRITKLEALITDPSKSSSVATPLAAQEHKDLKILPPPSPTAELVMEFQAAFQNNDRDAIRRIMPNELNIIDESENTLALGFSQNKTQLRTVSGGGSYLLIQRNNRDWLLPTFQTLTGMTTSQPAKGLFTYERQSVSCAELKRPAEVKMLGEVWEVVNMGIVIVPA